MRNANIRPVVLQLTRPATFAGRWYSDRPDRLSKDVAGYLSAAARGPDGDLVALISPHAGLMYSGPVAAFSYSLLQHRSFDVAVLVGPSHYEGFDGVAIHSRGSFATPLGPLPIDEDCARQIAQASSLVVEDPMTHAGEHSLEMQLPFLRTLQPDIRIVPLLMGYQNRATAFELAGALSRALEGRRALLIASTDLSHYYDAQSAKALDDQVIDLVGRFDAEGLMALLERRPEHACGGGPTVSVMLAARSMGATDSAILHYADSGDVSGDKDAVVGYLAAAFGRFMT
jgi:AmmeMemoRadiSam system protein B